MRLISLGSGSSGNGFIVDAGDVALLIDCGTAVRPCQAAIRDLGIAERLAGVLLSHEHIDHVRGLPSLMRRFDLPLITTRATHAALGSTVRLDERSPGDRFAIGSIEIELVSVSHDAGEPCGFVIHQGDRRLALFTDLGYVSSTVADALHDADLIVLESNYDVLMLANGPYPAHLQRRIRGPLGHLSNDDCAVALANAVTDRTQAVFLAHISDKNNTPELAQRVARASLDSQGLSTPVMPLPRYDRHDLWVTSHAQVELFRL